MGLLKQFNPIMQCIKCATMCWNPFWVSILMSVYLAKYFYDHSKFLNRRRNISWNRRCIKMIMIFQKRFHPTVSALSRLLQPAISERKTEFLNTEMDTYSFSQGPMYKWTEHSIKFHFWNYKVRGGGGSNNTPGLDGGTT